MKAITVRPGVPQRPELSDIDEPPAGEGSLLVEALAIGVCGTDREIVAGTYGEAPSGSDRLVLGHESLGRVLSAPPDSGFTAGDLVVGIVRHPDPVPCPACAHQQWDMCSNGLYTEHGIKGRDGFARERYRLQPDHAVRVDPLLGSCGVLLEPATILAKAWDEIDHIGKRAWWEPRRVLVLGAGPVGLMAALLATQHGLDVHVLDRVRDGPKPGLVRDLGATYHTGSVDDACDEVDIVIECTGAPALIFGAMHCLAPTGILCLTGVSAVGRPLTVDGGALNNEPVLENNVVFGSVNANRRHYELAAAALAQADPAWLERVVTRRVPLDRFADAYEPRNGDVKTVVLFAS